MSLYFFTFGQNDAPIVTQALKEKVKLWGVIEFFVEFLLGSGGVLGSDRPFRGGVRRLRRTPGR